MAGRGTWRCPRCTTWQAKGESRLPEAAAGDYLVWYQSINESNRRGRDLLLITGDEKEDLVIATYPVERRPVKIVANVIRDATHSVAGYVPVIDWNTMLLSLSYRLWCRDRRPAGGTPAQSLRRAAGPARRRGPYRSSVVKFSPGRRSRADGGGNATYPSESGSAIGPPGRGGTRDSRVGRSAGRAEPARRLGCPQPGRTHARTPAAPGGPWSGAADPQHVATDGHRTRPRPATAASACDPAGR